MARPSRTPTPDSLEYVLRRALRDSGQSQDDLARYLDRSQGWISGSLFGRAQDTLNRIMQDSPGLFVRILDFFRWDVERFEGETGLVVHENTRLFIHAREQRGSLKPARGKSIPIVAVINGGSKVQDIEDFIQVDNKYYRPGAVGMVYYGNSMTDPKDPDGDHSFRDGDVALIDCTLLEPMRGKLFAIELEAGRNVLKRCDKLPNGEFWLVSYNEDEHPPFQWDGAIVRGMVYAKIPKPIFLG